MRERERLMKLISDMPKEQTVAEMADYLLENGIIVPPVKAGDTVYTNVSRQGWCFTDRDKPYKAKVVYIDIDIKGKYIIIALNNHFKQGFTFNAIGKTVFLAREEAEKVLAERNGEK